MKRSAPPVRAMDGFAAERAAELLAKLSKEMDRARSHGDADSIHDLRVAVRRLSQCLQVFSDLFPNNSAKKVRRRIRTFRKLAGEVRDRDIAREYIEQHSLPAPPGMADQLAKERDAAYSVLTARLDRAVHRNRVAKWRKRLGLEAAE